MLHSLDIVDPDAMPGHLRRLCALAANEAKLSWRGLNRLWHPLEHLTLTLEEQRSCVICS